MKLQSDTQKSERSLHFVSQYLTEPDSKKSIKHLLLVFISAWVFALGLGISGMTDASKVIAFLDLSGQWDPSLAFVMVGAIGTHLIFYRLILKRQSPIYSESFRIPSRRDINGRLILGAGLFGMGWGLGGFCPGPGLVSSSTLAMDSLVFTAAMLLGMLAFNTINERRVQVSKQEKEAC